MKAVARVLWGDLAVQVSSIMRKNIDDILQRGDNLEDVPRSWWLAYSVQSCCKLHGNNVALDPKASKPWIQEQRKRTIEREASSSL